MNDLAKVAVIIALGSVVVALIWGSNNVPVVGTIIDDIPTDRLNKSQRPDWTNPGPAYLLSNLPGIRHHNDMLPVAAYNATFVLPSDAS